MHIYPLLTNFVFSLYSLYARAHIYIHINVVNLARIDVVNCLRVCAAMEDVFESTVKGSAVQMFS